MAASKPKASDAADAPHDLGPGLTPKVWEGEKTVQLIRHQDKFITPLMSEAEAQSLLDGYPGEYARYPIVPEAAPAAETDA